MPPLARHPSIAPHPLRAAVTELHVVGCDCGLCEADDDAPALGLRAIAGLGIAGFVVGTGLSALYDPAGTVAIAVDLFRWWLA